MKRTRHAIGSFSFASFRVNTDYENALQSKSANIVPHDTQQGLFISNSKQPLEKELWCGEALCYDMTLVLDRRVSERCNAVFILGDI